MINRAFIVKYRNKKTQRRKSTKWSSFRKERKNTQVLNDIYGFSPKCIHLENLFAVVYHPSFTVRLEAKFRRAEKRTTTKCFLTASSKVASRFFLLYLYCLDLAVSSWTKLPAYHFFSIVFLPNVTLVITVTIDGKCHELLKLRTFFERDMICACIIHIFQANMYVMDDMTTLLLLRCFSTLVSSWDICCTVKQVHVLYTQAHPTTHIRRFLSTSAVI